jgi:hypothetical protein
MSAKVAHFLWIKSSNAVVKRPRIQCQHCSNPDRDGPGSRCRFFWYTDIKARDAFLATPPGFDHRDWFGGQVVSLRRRPDVGRTR